jgi:adenosine deaminase
LELRTTPRVVAGAVAGGEADEGFLATLPATIAATEQRRGCARYVHVVAREMAAAEARGLPVVPRLLLSVNRTGSLAAAEDMLAVARHFASATTAAAAQAAAETDASAREYGPYVVGVELSGDPTRGDARTFLPLLADARGAGLRVSVHCGETMNVAETEAILDTAPDRLGHMCVLSPLTVQRLLAALPNGKSAGGVVSSSGAGRFKPLAAPIPIEVCPTSNALTLHLPSLHHHPTINPWLEAGYPLAICTDDSGVFDVTLSDEYADVAATYGLDRRRMAALARRSFDFAFADVATLARVVAAAEVELAAALALA